MLGMRAALCCYGWHRGSLNALVQINFGELAAFVTLGGLVLEYALGMAAVARGFSRYLARLCNLDQNLFVLEFYDCPPGLEPPDCPYTHSFDFMAAGVVVFVSFLLSIGVRESAFFITGRLHRVPTALRPFLGLPACWYFATAQLQISSGAAA